MMHVYRGWTTGELKRVREYIQTVDHPYNWEKMKALAESMGRPVGSVRGVLSRVMRSEVDSSD